MSDAFDTGAVTIDQYLERTVFYRKRPFSLDEFVAAPSGFAWGGVANLLVDP